MTVEAFTSSSNLTGASRSSFVSSASNSGTCIRLANYWARGNGLGGSIAIGAPPNLSDGTPWKELFSRTYLVSSGASYSRISVRSFWVRSLSAVTSVSYNASLSETCWAGLNSTYYNGPEIVNYSLAGVVASSNAENYGTSLDYPAGPSVGSNPYPGAAVIRFVLAMSPIGDSTYALTVENPVGWTLLGTLNEDVPGNLSSTDGRMKIITKDTSSTTSSSTVNTYFNTAGTGGAGGITGTFYIGDYATPPVLSSGLMGMTF